MKMLAVGSRVRDAEGLAGKVISVHDCGIQGNLLVIRLDKEDPILGKLTTAWEGEIEILDSRTGKEASE